MSAHTYDDGDFEDRDFEDHEVDDVDHDELDLLAALRDRGRKEKEESVLSSLRSTELSSRVQLRESHADLYRLRFSHFIVVIGTATAAAIHNFYPAFQPELPLYTKIFTLITTTLLTIGEISGLLSSLVKVGSSLGPNLNKLKYRVIRCAPLVLLDILVGLTAAICAICASSSGFANAIDAGAPRSLAIMMWLFHALSGAYNLYVFMITIQKMIEKYFIKFGPSCLISDSMRYKTVLRKTYSELIDRVLYRPSELILSMMCILPTERPEVLRAHSMEQLHEYVKNMLDRDIHRSGRIQKERLIIRGVRGLLRICAIWACLVFACTQMGSVYTALQDYIIPGELRELYQNLAPSYQERIISLSISSIFIQNAHSSWTAAGHLMLQLIRTIAEVIRWANAWVSLRYVGVSSTALILGIFSFSSLYFGAENGKDHIDFRTSYETNLLAFASHIVDSQGGLTYLHISLSIPIIISGLAILLNISSLIDNFNQLKNYILSGGQIIPCCYRSIPQNGHYALLAKLTLLLLLQKAQKHAGSRYYHALPPERFLTAVPPRHHTDIPLDIQQCMTLLEYYSRKAMEDARWDTGSEDSNVADAGITARPAIAFGSHYTPNTTHFQDDLETETLFCCAV